MAAGIPRICSSASAASGTHGAAASRMSGRLLQPTPWFTWQVSPTSAAAAPSRATAMPAIVTWMVEKVRSSSRAME